MVDDSQVKGGAKELGGKIKEGVGSLVGTIGFRPGHRRSGRGKTQKNDDKVKDAVKDEIGRQPNPFASTDSWPLRSGSGLFVVIRGSAVPSSMLRRSLGATGRRGPVEDWRTDDGRHAARDGFDRGDRGRR